MVVFFILLILLVQVAFLAIARNAAATAVDASVRRVAMAPATLDDERVRLLRDVHATIPGTVGVQVELARDGVSVRGMLSFEWQPPGPYLFPVSITVERQTPVVVPP
jgi:hypothetical protein